MFIGLLVALGAAFAKSGTDLGTKFAVQTIPLRKLLCIESVIGAILLIALTVIFTPGMSTHPVNIFLHSIHPTYWKILIVNGALNAMAVYFSIKAFKNSDASLVAPILLLTPIFLLITSPLMLGEFVSISGIFGIVFSIYGLYLLQDHQNGFFGTCKLLASDVGVRSMFITSMIWSVASNLDKLGVLASSPLIWSASVGVFIAMYATIFWFVSPREPASKHTWRAIIPATTSTAGIVLEMYALTYLKVPYVISIKRLSALITVALSGSLFKENIRRRLIATLILIAGAVITIISM